MWEGSSVVRDSWWKRNLLRRNLSHGNGEGNLSHNKGVELFTSLNAPLVRASWRIMEREK
jgi:hypothetical protein